MIEDPKIFEIITKKGITAPKGTTNWAPLKKILWILENVKDNSPVNALSPKSMSYLIYKFFEERMPEKSVLNTIARAKGFIMKGENKCYEITRKGREKLEEMKENLDKKLLYITGENPWTDRNSQFPEFIEKLKGEILILDPYYGQGTLHILSKFSKNTKIRFLSGQLGTSENSVTFSKEITRFKGNFKNIKLKIYPKSYEFHDRYILSDNYLVIVGHGIKDIGDKECFLIGISTDEIPEIIKNLRDKFNYRWNQSIDIK